jgi:putative tricarboxylic transport membrane protein
MLWAMMALTAGMGLVAADAGAAGFPEKPVELIVQSSAGGGSDLFARTLAAIVEKEKLLAQPIVVENRPGGSGMVAFSYVAGKRRNPYFLLTAGPGLLAVPIVRKASVTYKDFTPIANFAFDDFIVVVRNDPRFKSVADVVAEARAHPKKVMAGGTQVGSTDSIGTYLFEKAAGVQFNYISFTGAGEVNAALMGGHVDLAMLNPGEAMELAKAKKVRVLCVMAEKRHPGAPDVPACREQGVDVVWRQHRGLAAPAEIPGEARKVLEEAFFKCTQSAGFKKYLEDNSIADGWMDGSTFGAWMERESNRYQEILTGMGLLKK